MRTISIVGLGTMAAAIGARAVRGGNAVEVTGRDSAKAEELAKKLGGGTTAGAFGAVPAGDIVILAVPHAAAAPILAQYGDALAGKIIVDISNPLTEDLSAKVTPGGTSAAQLIARAAPASARVVKAFDVVFGEVLADVDRPADVLIAGDDPQAKAEVSAFIETLGLHPRDTGDLTMAEWLEGAALLIIGLAKQNGNADFTLGIDVHG
ncbi:NADPH-dependent F420 reductase [Catenulispora rubra]|uniref:NADPH-dependent F420 reductase n=1 Tax=Catenulispora rubra TaxID=280293 RepID=UPI00189235FF|nr:NAD(P)-binding domain-containing protein [Catenulispora rubra]